MRNKKGNVTDIIFGVVMLFVLLVGFAAFFPVWNNVIVSLNESDAIRQETKDDLAFHQDNIPATMNGMFVLVFFGTFGGVIALAFFVRSNVMYLFLAITLITIFGFVGAVFANTYDDFLSTNPEYEEYFQEKFALSDHLIRNYPLYIFILSLLALVSLYAKPSGNVGSGI